MGPYPGLDIGGYFSDKVQQISEGIFKGYFSDLLYFHIFHILDWIARGIFQIRYNRFQRVFFSFVIFSYFHILDWISEGIFQITTDLPLGYFNLINVEYIQSEFPINFLQNKQSIICRCLSCSVSQVTT